MISVNNLHVSLGGRTILDGVTFDLQQSDFLAVVGPNGGGKSTLIRSIMGLVDRTEGEIMIGTDKTSSRATVGYVPQIKSLDRTFPAISIELVLTSFKKRWPAYISASDRSQAISALQKVGAEHLANKAIGELSGGELQRVYLARTFLQSPDIILLDEPETGIDASGSADLHAVLDRFRADEAGLIVMVTHDWDVAFHHASHALLLNTRQISFGTPSIALNNDAIREAYGHIGHKHAVLTGHGHHSSHTHQSEQEAHD